MWRSSKSRSGLPQDVLAPTNLHPASGAETGLDRLDENNYRLSMASKPETTSQPHPSPRVTSEALLGQRRELVIVHKGRDYKLRLTQNGKLILTA
jgi:hemin uptake protein HemP